jgi:hypothetical protein
MYSLYEYNKAGHMKVIKEEAFEKGHDEGFDEGFGEGFGEGYENATSHIVASLLNKGKSPEDISSSCDIPLDTVLAIKKSMKRV